MGQDDLSLNDTLAGQKDLASQVKRFNKVNDIIQRAIARLAIIQDDLGAAGPSGDPTVQAVLQQIVASAAGAAGLAIPSAPGTTNAVDGIIVKVIKQPGPNGTPDVTKTLNLIQQIGGSLSGGPAAGP
ncbi:MAG TPA: hypothetical protein VGH87_03170 [Polyangiaceae bacterium]|jgi:hypothetical protein|nr:hypothetical protein [Polyangiaceae bacterium]